MARGQYTPAPPPWVFRSFGGVQYTREKTQVRNMPASALALNCLEYFLARELWRDTDHSSPCRSRATFLSTPMVWSKGGDNFCPPYFSIRPTIIDDENILKTLAVSSTLLI